jgi:hypothetical protein
VVLWCVGATVEGATLSAALSQDTIYEGETAEVVVTLANARSDATPVAPEVAGLTIQLTPTYESRKSIINGVVTSSRVYRFSIQPARTGEYDIPAFTWEGDGMVLRTRPLRLRVLPGQNPAVSRHAFLQLKVEKKRVYVGEALPVEIGVAYQNGVYRSVPQLEQEGLIMGRVERLPSRVERVSGVDYRVDPYRTYVVAARAGGLKLGPAKLPFGLRTTSRLGLLSGEMVQVELRSEVVELEVLPLPGDAVPEGFTGAVGEYAIALEASTNAVVAGDPILLTLDIRGRGPIESLQLASLDGWDGFKTYAPETSVELSDNLGLSGVKRFTQVVIPESAKVTEIPAIKFSYFDPATATYRTLTTDAIPIAVRRGATIAGYPPGVDLGDAGGGVAESREMAHIKSGLGRYGMVQAPLVTRPWFVGLHVLPLVLWLGSLVWRRHEMKLDRDPMLRRRREVRVLIRKGLVDLRQAAAAKDAERFFGIAIRLLQERLSEKSGYPAPAIDELNLDEVFRGMGDDALLAEVRGLFQACSVARYAPNRENAELDAFLPRVDGVLSRIERMKRR